MDYINKVSGAMIAGQLDFFWNGDVMKTIVTYGLATYTATICTHQMLSRYIAIRQLQIPPRPPAKKDEPKAKPKSKLHRRLQFAAELAGFLAYISFFWCLGFFVFPRLGNQLLVDTIFGGIVLWLMQSITAEALPKFLPPKSRSVKYCWSENRKSLHFHFENGKNPDGQEHFFDRKKVKKTVGWSASALILLANWAGFTWVSCLVSSLWIMFSLGGTIFARQKMRWVIWGMVGIEAVLGSVFTGASIYESYKSKSPKSQSKKSDMTPPSDWLLNPMMVFTEVHAILWAAFLVSINYRYDYLTKSDVTLSTPSKQLNEKEASEDIDVAAGELGKELVETPEPVKFTYDDNRYFTRPIYRASFTSLVISIPIIALWNVYSPPSNKKNTPVFVVGMVATPIIVLLSSAVAAWRNGELRRWYRYEEVWIPKVDHLLLEDSATGEEDAMVDAQL